MSLRRAPLTKLNVMSIQASLACLKVERAVCRCWAFAIMHQLSKHAIRSYVQTQPRLHCWAVSYYEVDDPKDHRILPVCRLERP